MRAAVLQSNYLPWRGYFDLIHDVDVFVFYDDVQYTLNDWRNRNRVKTANGVVWITIPIGNQNDRRICDVEIKDRGWMRRHWMTIEQSYKRAAHFESVAPFFRSVYEREWRSLSELNQTTIKAIARDMLGVTTEFRDSREFALQSAKGDRLLSLLQQLGADEYVSGPAARAYLDADAYAQAGVSVTWKDYGSYPEYPQLHGAFVPDVSIVDVLMCCGDRAPQYLWGYRGTTETRV
jgi:WbqC-like protein family